MRTRRKRKSLRNQQVKLLILLRTTLKKKTASKINDFQQVLVSLFITLITHLYIQ